MDSVRQIIFLQSIFRVQWFSNLWWWGIQRWREWEQWFWQRRWQWLETLAGWW